jgi:hypothetical protein
VASLQYLESFILDLDRALAWLGALGIEPNHTRFGKYRKILGTVREHRMAGTLNELRLVVPLEQYRIALIESTHLVAIAKAFTRIPGPRFRVPFFSSLYAILLSDRNRSRDVVHASHAPSGEVYGQPSGRLAVRRPRYTMGTVRGDQDIVTRPKLTFAFALDP